MRENTLKQRLYAGKAAFGVMCTFPSPSVVEMSYFHSGVNRLLQQSSDTYLKTVRQAAADAGK
jgi:hypothetical protein